MIAKKGEAVVDSRLIAEKFEKTHAKVVRKIDNLIRDIGEINSAKSGSLKFTKLNTEYRGRPYNYYEMNRESFSLLVMSFTGKKALDWRIKFNAAFYAMEKMLIQQNLNQQSEQWKMQREQSKLIRREETDVIKQFVEYATKQGSTQAQFYYKHVTTAVYKCLGLIQFQKPKLRETLDLMQTNQLILAEMTARKSLLKYMEEGEHYKSIFTLVKQDLERFADSFLFKKLN